MVIFLVQTHVLQAQEISARVLDSNTRQPVAFATVQFAPGKGVITNEEGNFSLYAKLSEKDTLLISSVGYETLKVNTGELSGTAILLKATAIELDNVFLTNKNLKPEEIIQKVKENVESNYNFDLTHMKFFFRESNVNNVGRFDLIVNKSTFDDLDQALMTQISEKVPRYSDSYKEILGDFYGNYSNQKLQVIKAANLHNPQSTEGLTELMDKLESIFKENIKSNSFLKIKTGIIGVKLDAEELEFGSSEDENKKETEKTPEEIEKSLEQKKKNLQNSTTSKIKSLLGSAFWVSDNTMDVLKNSRKYKFTMEGYLQMEDEIVYVINFEPKRGATFKGKLYVNTFDYRVHRLEYQNVKTLNSFRLLGISNSKDVYRGKMIFRKDENGKYNPGYMEIEKGESFGIHRPLKIIEKNKFVKGRRKQNELDLKIKINSGQLTKHQLVVYEDSPIDIEQFKDLKTSTSFDYETFNVYNPEFWNGYNIMEPNAAIRAFTTPADAEQVY